MILDLLQSSKYRIYNIKVARVLGVNATLVLMELADAQGYFDEKWFFTEYQTISENTALSVYAIRNAVKFLKEKGIIDTEMRGVPAKQFFKINEEKLEEILNPRRARPIEVDRSGHSELDRSLYKERKNKDRKNEIENRSTSLNSETEEKHSEVQNIWIRTFGRNPKLPEAEKTIELIEKFGKEKVLRIFREAVLRNVKSLQFILDNLDDEGNLHNPYRKARDETTTGVIDLDFDDSEEDNFPKIVRIGNAEEA